MPYFETPDELAEYLADVAGIYSDSRCAWVEEYQEFLHIVECKCREFWVPWITDRIRESVENEQKVKS